MNERAKSLILLALCAALVLFSVWRDLRPRDPEQQEALDREIRLELEEADRKYQTEELWKRARER